MDSANHAPCRATPSAPGTAVDDTFAASVLHAIQASVKSIGLAGAESRTHRECLVADCLGQIRQVVVDRGEFLLRVLDDGFEVAGVRLPANPETLELRGLLQRGGLRAVRIAAGVEDRELRMLLRILGTCGTGPQGRDDDLPLIPSLQTAAFHDVCFAGRLTPLPDVGEHAECDDGWPGANVRSNEPDAAVAVALAVLQDLSTLTPVSPYRDRAVAMLVQILRRLLRDCRLRAALSLFDAFDVSPALRDADRLILQEALQDFRSERFVHDLLGRVPPDAALAAFVRRLGPQAVHALLHVVAAEDVSGLPSLLESLARSDPRSFHSALDSEDPAVQEQALLVLARTQGSIPASLLVQLAETASNPIRERAIALLIEQHPRNVSTMHALAGIEIASSASRRLALLHHVAKHPDATALEPLVAHLQTRAPTLDVSERRAFVLAITACGGSRAVPFLRDYAAHGPEASPNGPDDRLYAIAAIERIDGESARDPAARPVEPAAPDAGEPPDPIRPVG